MNKKLSDIFTIQDHQKMIDRYVRILQGESANTALLTDEELRNKIEWHAKQYALKTGKLPY